MLLRNSLPAYGAPLLPCDLEALGTHGATAAEAFLHSAFDDGVSPLHDLPRSAARYGVGRICVKDETRRLGLGSFKAVGGAYAVMRLACEHATEILGRHVGPGAFTDPDVRAAMAGLTVTCATAGNHGRSVAFGARAAGARAVIFVHDNVSRHRVDAIARLGAVVVYTHGSYDEAVAESNRSSEEQGWLVVSDTAWPGYERIPLMVMQGYTVMVREALDQMGGRPTHVFVQAGVGGLAAAVAGHLEATSDAIRPTIVVVEPSRAACLHDSAARAARVRIPSGTPTSMSMLECYEPSLVAWRVLERTAEYFMTVDDAAASECRARLANPTPGDVALVTSDSGAAGITGLTAVLETPTARERLGIGRESVILAFCTEGPNDVLPFLPPEPRVLGRTVGRAHALPARQGRTSEARNR